MPEAIISALFSSFLLVKLIKGPWMRNPQYLGLAMLGAMLATMVLGQYSPGMEDEFIARNLASFAGAFAAIMAFDRAVGHG